MPLNLLPKKSWNVYSTANIERVKSDEQAALLKAQQAEAKQRDQDAAAQLRSLRGEADEQPRPSRRISDAEHTQNHRSIDNPSSGFNSGRGKRRRSTSPREVELDKLSNTKFRDAAGYNTKPSWYLTSQPLELHQQSENSPKRVRGQVRLTNDDPLASMKRGVKRLREVEREREEWKRTREREVGLGDVEDNCRSTTGRSRDERSKRHRSSATDDKRRRSRASEDARGERKRERHRIEDGPR